MRTTRRRFLQGAAALIGLATIDTPAAAIERFYSIPNEVALRNVQRHGGFTMGEAVGHLNLHDTSAEALREAERNLTAGLERAKAGWQIRYRAQGGEFTSWAPLEPTESPGQFTIGEKVRLNAGVGYEFQIWQPIADPGRMAAYQWQARPPASMRLERMGGFAREQRIDYQRETHGPPWEDRTAEVSDDELTATYGVPRNRAGHLRRLLGQAVSDHELRVEL